MKTKQDTQSKWIGEPLTDFEVDQLSEVAAKAICTRGYTPAQAARIVKMSDHAFAKFCEWYRDWAK